MEVSEISFLRNGIIEPDIFAVEGRSFLERMRHTSSYDLVHKIKTFIMTFTSMEGSPDSFSSRLQQFLEDIAVILVDHPLWKEEDEKGLKIAMEALERYLLTRLYSTAFYLPTSTDCDDDEKFYHRVRTLQFLQPDHLDLPNRKYNQIAFEMGAQELSRLEEDLLKSPREKLACIINAVIIVINLLKHSTNDTNTGADDILPYLIYLLLLTSPKHIHSNLRYIRRFRRHSMLTSEEAYYLLQMESAVMFISTLDHTSLSIIEEDFVRGVAEATDKIKKGMDVPRQFSRENGWERLLVDLAATNLTFTEKGSSSLPNTSSSSLLATISSSMSASHTEVIQEEGDKQKECKGPQFPSEGDTVAFPLSEETEEDEERSDILSVSTSTVVPQFRSHLLLTVKDCIIPKFLQTSFEELSVQDLKHLYTCYKTIARRLEELEERVVLT